MKTRVEVRAADDGYGVVIQSSLVDADSDFDFLITEYDSLKDEEVYGLGLQYTVWNHMG